jgi:hypothetical protein
MTDIKMVRVFGADGRSLCVNEPDLAAYVAKGYSTSRPSLAAAAAGNDAAPAGGNDAPAEEKPRRGRRGKKPADTKKGDG